ncbi:MAG: hypothetical protein JXN59_00750 [Anaerolineae bacterium]|nr:hypothetical protein [Anaerolineae bacterium]
MIHPLSVWVTRRKPRPATRAAGIGLGLGCAVLALGVWAWHGGHLSVLRGLLITGGVGMLLLPAGTAAVAGVLTVLETRGEQFQFLLLTSLPEQVMVRGVFFAAQYRTRAFRAAAMALLPAFVIGALAWMMQVFMSVLNGVMSMMGPPRPPDPGLPALVLTGIALVLWSMNLVAARVGAALALRWRSEALVVALAPASMLLIVLSPLLIALNLVLWPFFCLGAMYLVVWMSRYLAGNGLLHDATRWLRQCDVV